MNIPLYGVTFIMMTVGIIFLVVGYSVSDKPSDEKKKVLWIDFGWVLTILAILIIGYDVMVKTKVPDSVRLKGLTIGSTQKSPKSLSVLGGREKKNPKGAKSQKSSSRTISV